MRIKFVWSVIIALFTAASGLRADVVEMQNGDRYSGKVLAVSADSVVLASDMLGKIAVPRKNVVSLAFGTNSVALPVTANVPRAVTPTNPPAIAAAASPMANTTNANLSAQLRHLGANTNFVAQIRQQMLAGSPEASGKYDEMVNGLLSGQLNVNDVRQEAQSSAEQLREMKRELGPDADASLDGYLQVLDDFIKETDPGQSASTSQPASPSP